MKVKLRLYKWTSIGLHNTATGNNRQNWYLTNLLKLLHRWSSFYHHIPSGKGSQLLVLCLVHAYRNGAQNAWTDHSRFNIFQSISYPVHTTVGITFCTRREHMGHFCSVYFFFPRASPRENSFVHTAVQNSPSQQENMTTGKELFTAI